MSKVCRGRVCIHTQTRRGMPSPGGPAGRTDIPEAGAKKRQGELGSRQGDTGSLTEAAAWVKGALGLSEKSGRATGMLPPLTTPVRALRMMNMLLPS